MGLVPWSYRFVSILCFFVSYHFFLLFSVMKVYSTQLCFVLRKIDT